MIDADNLWRSILQYAIQGKLVPQDPKDEPASILLDRINEEKQRLVKEGKIKNDKKESRIYCKDGRWFESDGRTESEIEVPFEIPSSWEWVRLYTILSTGKDESVKSQTIPDDGYVIQLENIEKNTGAIIGTTDPRKLKPSSTQRSFSRGCILYSKLRPYLNKVIIPPNDGYCSTELIALYFSSELDLRCYQLWLMSQYFIDYSMALSFGSKMPRLNVKEGIQCLLPVPPLNEQKRIVAKIDELKPLVDKYKELDHERTVLDDSLSVLLRKSLLQYAIQGKLVPQDPNDEPASVLLDRINEEKQRLVREGKLKKDKKESRIYRKDGRWYEVINGEDERCVDNEIPFEIPDSWIWIRGISLFNKMKSTRPTGDRFRYIDLDSIDNINQKIESPKIIETLNAPSRATRLIVPGDVLFSMVRPYLKNIALVSNEYKDCIASTGFFVCNFDHSITEPEYIFNLMRSPFVVNGLNNFMKGENSPSICNKDIEYFLYPIPPIDEQKRIVAELQKIDSLIYRKA